MKGCLHPYKSFNCTLKRIIKGSHTDDLVLQKKYGQHARASCVKGEGEWGNGTNSLKLDYHRENGQVATNVSAFAPHG